MNGVSLVSSGRSFSWRKGVKLTTLTFITTKCVYPYTALVKSLYELHDLRRVVLADDDTPTQPAIYILTSFSRSVL